jgi:DNA end-binding protein Ku
MADPAESAETDEEGIPGRPMWSGTVSFGLVNIPVQLIAGIRHTKIKLRMLGAQGTPLSRRYASSVDAKQIAPEHMVRGYEIEPGQFVVIEDSELQAIAPEMSRDINLQRFVKVDEIDPVFFDRPYYLVPATGVTKAYALLAAVMEDSKRAGIATFVMRGKEYLIAILADGGLLRAQTLHFADEIRSVEQIGLPKKQEPKRSDLTHVQKAIRQLAGKSVKPAELIDERNRRLVELIAAKQRAGEVVDAASAEESGDAVVIDLFEKLKRSLRKGPKSKGTRKATHRAA